MRRVVVALAGVVLVSGCGGGGDAEQEATMEEPAMVTAQEVAEAFEEAGLPLTDARDTSEGCGDPAICTSRVTSEDVSVYGYDSVEDAEAYVDTAGEGWHQDGPIVLGYAPSETPEELQGRYEDELAKVVGQ